MKNIDKKITAIAMLKIIENNLFEKLYDTIDNLSEVSVKLLSNNKIKVKNFDNEWTLIVDVIQETFLLKDMSMMTLLLEKDFELFVQIKDVIVNYMNQEENE